MRRWLKTLTRKLRRPLFIRRVEGESMAPSLKKGSIVLASSLRLPKLRDMVIAKKNGREIIKRVQAAQDDMYFLIGDNFDHSTDSRTFGPVVGDSIYGSVLWYK